MAEFAREERGLEAVSLERNIEQRSGAGARFARFHASMQHPREIEFTRSMILTRPDHAPREGWDFRPFIISVGILAAATILYALDESSILTLGPAREFLGRGPPAGSRLLPAPAVGSQTLPTTVGAGLPSSVPGGAVADQVGGAGTVALTELGWPATAPTTLSPYDKMTMLRHMEAPGGGGATGASNVIRAGRGFTGAAEEWSILALAEDFGRLLPTSRESRDEELGMRGSSARETNDQDNAPSKLDEVEAGNITDVMPIEIENPAAIGPLVRIATLKHKENVPAVLDAFDRSLGQNTLGQNLRFYTASIEIGDSFFHAVYVGPFETARAATIMCEEMRAHGGDCSLAAR